MGTPAYKVYDGDEYLAAVKDSTLAAALIGAALGEGAIVKLNGRIVWREGEENIRAADSYDTAAAIMNRRASEHYEERLARLYPDGVPWRQEAPRLSPGAAAEVEASDLSEGAKREAQA